MICPECRFDIDELLLEANELRAQNGKLQSIVIASDRSAFEARALLERAQFTSELGEIEFMRQKFTQLFRRNKKRLATVERKILQTPTSDLLNEAAELRGLLKGVERCVAALECRATDTDLLSLLEVRA